MKTFSFYVLIVAPMLILALLNKLALLNPMVFMAFLLLYAVIYHPTVVGLRLLGKHVIAKHDFVKTYIPFWNLRYYSEAFS
jgi:hypothetical protein